MSYKALRLIYVICGAIRLAQCDSAPAVSSAGAPGGFGFEMVMTKLQTLEHNFIESDLQTEEKLAVLSSRIDNLVKSIENLAWVAQQTGETVNQLGLNGRHVGHNLSTVQRDLTELLAGQKLLVTGQQFGEYLLQRGCNGTNLPVYSGSRGAMYASCGKVPFPVSGVYRIRLEDPFKEPMTVLCDQEYESGGWVVIHQRFDGSTNFYRNWKEYKNGFGNLNGEFWLGLDRIYELTVSRPHELVVLMEDFEGNKTYAKYDLFEIGDEATKYAMKNIGAFSGTAGDSMGELKGMKFSTLDADNDTWGESCAVSYTGAWWYGACHKSNLNGRYLRGETKEYASGMVWYTFRGHHYALKSAKMMIRPKTSQ